jgi:hypothetical protein
MNSIHLEIFDAYLNAAREGESTRSKLSPEELARIAAQRGFRDAKAMQSWWEDHFRALRLFATHAAFLRLWKLLVEMPEVELRPDYYADRVLDAIQDWHRRPRLTQAERANSHKRIQDLCRRLEAELAVVSPGSSTGLFERFHFSHAQAVKAFELFEAAPDPRRPGSEAFKFSCKLELAGVTPLWSVRNIRRQASASVSTDPLFPRKIRAAAAKRTYLINALHRILDCLTLQPSFHAELVSLLVHADCDADDVRKATVEFERANEKWWELVQGEPWRSAGLSRPPESLDERRMVALHEAEAIQATMQAQEDFWSQP